MNKNKNIVEEEEEEDNEMGQEMWLVKDQDIVLDLNQFYTDFPPLPEFPCMSSSSSSSSAPVPVKAASSTSSSASSDAYLAMWKSDSEDKTQIKKYHHLNNNSTTTTTQQQQQQTDDDGRRALSSTASMDPLLPPPENSSGGGDIDCLNVMENFGCMDLIDDSDIWDNPSPMFENNTQEGSGGEQIMVDSNQQQMQEEEEENGGGLYFLKGNTELSAIFLDWLKQNRDCISAQDMRSIKLKRSTIESASKRLGGSNEGKKKLLKLILEWVEQHQLQKKKTKDQTHQLAYQYQDPVFQNPNSISELNLNCNSVHLDPNSSCWMPPPPLPLPPPSYAVQQPGGGYVCDLNYSNGVPFPGLSQICNGSYYPIDSQETWSGHPFAVSSSQFNSVSGNGNFGVVQPQNPQVSHGNSHVYQVFDENGERLLKLGPSATKEARKNRMARHRRLAVHHHYNRHGNHQAAHHDAHDQMMNEQKGRDFPENYPSSEAAPWVYWPPPAASGSHASGQQHMASSSFDGSHQYMQNFKVEQLQSQHHHQNMQGYQAERNLKFLLQKVLKQSDVCNLGRIVLPKKEAEMHLPELDTRDGISIAIEDIGTSNVWIMRYRFWPNNKSRMYLLENTGEFVRLNDLQEGDFIVLYSDTKSGKYLIRGVKVREPESKPASKSSEQSKKPTRKSRNSPQAGNANKNT